MYDRTRFFGKNRHWAKMTKNGKKFSKDMVFEHFKKIRSLVFSGNSHLGKWAILGPKVAHPLNSGSKGRIFF